jgi:L-ascorbate metabolism protein UlaG (beta-lactamase superfamily)
MNSIKKDGKYYNYDSIKMEMNLDRFKGMGKDYMQKENAIPPLPIPRVSIDKKKFHSFDSLVWLGHSTILGNLDGVSFIVDPMFGLRASPVQFMGPKRFEGSLTPVEELPKVDIILITHNHYDHLDKGTILSLSGNVEKIYVPLDNKKILLKWGVEEKKIKEFDWFEDIEYKGVEFSFCPSQHFSGRGLTDRDKYLWGSWAVFGNKHSIFVSGDSGYNEHFKMIAGRYGSFDIACMECGAYNENWSEIHMLPEESIQAGVDLNAKVILPMHWAGFDLSTHAWDEPITRALKKADELKIDVTTPMIGEVLEFKNAIQTRRWWKDLV